jgi:hypothetical protein
MSKENKCLIDEKVLPTVIFKNSSINKEFFRFSPLFNVENDYPHSYPQLQVVESVESG